VLAAAVGGGVELLLGKRREEQAQPLELLRIQDPVEDPVEVVGGDQLPLRDVPQIGAGGQVDRGWKFGQEPVGQVEVEIEATSATAASLFTPASPATASTIPSAR
jgi:hypothetical protein